MASLALLGLVAVTSLAAYLLGARWLGLAPRGLRPAALDAVEWVGLAVLFLAGNLAVGVAVILGLRALTGEFITVYVLSDVTLVFLSLLQGALFQWWRRAGAGRRSD
jgi:hypothetical protein